MHAAPISAGRRCGRWGGWYDARGLATVMRCPFCGHDDTQVKDSRPTEDSAAIRRRRFCTGCGQRFTTIERVQLRELTVLKADGRRGCSTATSSPARSRRAAQAPGVRGADGAHRQRHRPPVGGVGRERHSQQAGRRDGDGDAEGGGRGGLCAFCQRLPQLPRGEGISRPFWGRSKSLHEGGHGRSSAYARGAGSGAAWACSTWPNPSWGA